MNSLMQASQAAQVPTICLVDDDASVLRATSRLLEISGYSVLTFSSPTHFFARQKVEGPGCVILDLNLPEMTGLDVQAMAEREGDSMPILFMSGEGSIPDSVRALKAGAVDFLEKPVPAEVLLSTVAQAVERHRVTLASRESKASWTRLFETLTPREREVCLLVVQGMLNKQIAGDLDIAERTVKTHRARVMAKLGVQSVADLVRFLECIEVQFPAIELREPTRL
jgi:FixJ family two-component response regulator